MPEPSGIGDTAVECPTASTKHSKQDSRKGAKAQSPESLWNLCAFAPLRETPSDQAASSPTSACFSRPFRATSLSTRLNPVVPPPANFSRASGTPAADQFTGINNLIVRDQFIDASKLIHQPSTTLAAT
jgi:hypothetical protein